MRVARVGAGAGSGMNGTRARARRLLAGPEVTVVVVEHRDRLGRANAGLAGAALAPYGGRWSSSVTAGSPVTWCGT